jgi:hypothetical protein
MHWSPGQIVDQIWFVICKVYLFFDNLGRDYRGVLTEVNDNTNWKMRDAEVIYVSGRTEVLGQVTARGLRAIVMSRVLEEQQAEASTSAAGSQAEVVFNFIVIYF